MTPSQEAAIDLSLNKNVYTLQDESGHRIVLSLDNGLIWESWHQGDEEVIQQAGAVIGPHAGARSYIQGEDPFIDGVGTCVPWQCVEISGTQLTAQLQGTTKWKDDTLAMLEGQPFILDARITLTQAGVLWQLSVRAESDGLIGLRCPIPCFDKAASEKQSREEPEVHVDAKTGVQFLLKGYRYDITGKMTSKNAEYSWRIDPTKSSSNEAHQLVFFAARHPEKPILTINQLEILFTLQKP